MAIASGELLIIVVILVGLVISVFVVFWEGLRRLVGAAPPPKTGEPLPNADYTKYVWNAEDVGKPPVRKTVILTYDAPQRVNMSFFLDLTRTKDAYLDPVKPIRINGDILPLKDLPADPEKLRAVKKEAVDVTKYVRTGPQGIPNDFEVNYIVRGRFKSLRGSEGKMTLLLAVMMPKAGSGIIGPTKFCMNCQYSMPMSGKFCPNCGVPVEAFSGAETKECVNCKETIAANATFCSNCGAVQPNPPPKAPAAPDAMAGQTS
ncbi:MAG TPA: zinc ribbon domain-containing protein [Nitrososphaerales archaeon]|nr:zinc ribbon domain-containing protein [Nitrososphaerales archaeon]HUK74294.1 zinc ribbon domain-containing protein [Nitrososphaerales archaeon]